jgi:hypothetical protein
MQAVERPHVLAGIALAGAGLVAATPIAALLPGGHTLSTGVRLASGEAADTGASVMNIPQNLLTDILNTPYYEFEAPYTLPSYLDYATAAGPAYDAGAGPLTHLPTTTDGAINELTNSLNYVGNFLQYDQTSIFGWDPGDPPKLAALIDVLNANPALSMPLGYESNVIAEAEFPESAGCPLSCPDPAAILSQTLQVPLSQLESGYTFGNVVDQYTGEPLPWANTTETLNPNAAMDGFIAQLEEPPSQNPLESGPSLETVFVDLNNFNMALANDFNFLVPGNFLLNLFGTPATGATAGDPSVALYDPSQGLGFGSTTELSSLLGGLAPELGSQATTNPLDFIP